MIISRQHFDINNRCAIEKLIIKTPFRYAAALTDEACFLYFKDGESEFNSSTEKLNLIFSESILLRCGNYFADLIQKEKSETCEIYVIHLHSEILKEIYKKEGVGGE